MPRSVRRFVLVQAFLLWQGGFVFYTAVVVPIGSDEVGVAAQGFVTRRVTVWLNLFGAAWAAAFLWDVLSARDPDRRRRRTRWLGWGLCVAVLVGLVALRGEMNELLDPAAKAVRDPAGFRRLHILYLWGSTTHWAAGLALVWLTLRAWAAEDRG